MAPGSRPEYFQVFGSKEPEFEVMMQGLVIIFQMKKALTDLELKGKIVGLKVRCIPEVPERLSIVQYFDAAPAKFFQYPLAVGIKKFSLFVVFDGFGIPFSFLKTISDLFEILMLGPILFH